MRTGRTTRGTVVLAVACALAVMGLATDCCIKFTALDAAALGFKTRVIADGCRGVLLEPDDVEKAVAEMRTAGVTMVGSAEI